MNTAANPQARRLFPGQSAREALNAATIREQPRLLGLPSGAAREAALRQIADLVRQSWRLVRAAADSRVSAAWRAASPAPAVS
jgi:hypothetical protein